MILLIALVPSIGLCWFIFSTFGIVPMLLTAILVVLICSTIEKAFFPK